MKAEPITPMPFVLVGTPAGPVCVDGVCGPPGDQASQDEHQQDEHHLEYVDRGSGTARAEPADAGEEAPSSGG